MSDEKKSNWDCYLRGVKAPESPTPKDSWLKRRADAVRRDAFPESPAEQKKPTEDAARKR
jgi:hypothetical protein